MGQQGIYRHFAAIEKKTVPYNKKLKLQPFQKST